MSSRSGEILVLASLVAVVSCCAVTAHRERMRRKALHSDRTDQARWEDEGGPPHPADTVAAVVEAKV